MAVTDFIVAFLACGVLAVFAVLGWRIVTLLQSALQSDRQAAGEVLNQMQANHARMLSKMEHWHEEEVRAARAHTERVMQFCMTEQHERAFIVKTQTQERHEEQVNQAAHSTNERVLDAKEAAARNAMSVQEVNHPQTDSRIRVPRSPASVNRGVANEGVIPQRHT